MACEDCGIGHEHGTVMVPMKPGRDGIPWEYCLRCFLEGTKPMKLGMFKTTTIADPKLYDALVAASEHTPGLINMDRAREKPRGGKRKAS